MPTAFVVKGRVPASLRKELLKPAGGGAEGGAPGGLVGELEGLEELLACGVVEELGVVVLGDGGVGVAEEFADDFEAEAVVEEVAGVGAAECVGADLGESLRASGR